MPSAPTTSADTRLSTVIPCVRVSQPEAAAQRQPGDPVVELMPSGVDQAVERGPIDVGKEGAGST
jgi:hypothetical protein